MARSHVVSEGGEQESESDLPRAEPKRCKSQNADAVRDLVREFDRQKKDNAGA